MRILLALSLSLALSTPSSGQSNPQGKATKATPSSPCKEERGSAALDGFFKGMEAQLSLASTRISESDSPLPMQLMVEEFEESNTYRLAVAEVLRTHFSDRLVVVPKSPLALYITGGRAAQARSLQMAIVVFVDHRMVAGKRSYLVPGRLEVSSIGGVLLRHSDEQATQTVKEWTYKMVSEFLQKWEQATESDK